MDNKINSEASLHYAARGKMSCSNIVRRKLNALLESAAQSYRRIQA